MVLNTCVIVGAQSKTSQDVTGTVLKMLRTANLDFPAATEFSLHLLDTLVKIDSSERLERTLFSPSAMALGTACFPSSGKCCITMGKSKSSSVSLIGKVFNLPGAHTSLIESFERRTDSTDSIEHSSKLFLESLDGQYAFALRRGDTFLLARDPIGVKPLYFAENDRLIAFSSRRRPLWEIGMTDCRILSQPIIISRGKARRVKAGITLESHRAEENCLVDSLIINLTNALEKMAASSDNKIAILFSGGLDSSVIAKLSENLGIRSTLYCAGTSTSRDIANARRMSSALDLPLVEKEITFDDVTSSLLPAVRLIESAEMITISTSLPFYFALEQCASKGEKIALHGQGADELFCGYQRYANALTNSGYHALCKEMLNDIVGLGATLPLYDQIGIVKRTQLFAPFADRSVVEFSLGIPVQLKLSKEGSKIVRKHVLRKLASKIGVPVQLLPIEKVAAQFGSGVARIMDKASRKAGFTKSIAKKMGFPLPVQAYLREVARSVGFPY
jgi:asparagine synthase (glutamine-hydrolysing)